MSALYLFANSLATQRIRMSRYIWILPQNTKQFIQVPCCFIAGIVQKGSKRNAWNGQMGLSWLKPLPRTVLSGNILLRFRFMLVNFNDGSTLQPSVASLLSAKMLSHWSRSCLRSSMKPGIFATSTSTVASLAWSNKLVKLMIVRIFNQCRHYRIDSNELRYASSHLCQSEFRVTSSIPTLVQAPSWFLEENIRFKKYDWSRPDPLTLPSPWYADSRSHWGSQNFQQSTFAYTYRTHCKYKCLTSLFRFL